MSSFDHFTVETSAFVLFLLVWSSQGSFGDKWCHISTNQNLATFKSNCDDRRGIVCFLVNQIWSLVIVISTLASV